MPASPTAITSDPDCGGEPVNGGAYTYTTRPLQHCRQRLGRQRSGTCSSSHSKNMPGAHSTRSKLTQLAGLALAALSNAKSRESGEQTGKPFQ